MFRLAGGARQILCWKLQLVRLRLERLQQLREAEKQEHADAPVERQELQLAEDAEVSLTNRALAVINVNFQIRYERGPVRRAKMATPASRTDETTRVCARSIRREHALACRARDSGHEHGPTVHESAGEPDSRAPGEQQLLLD